MRIRVQPTGSPTLGFWFPRRGDPVGSGVGERHSISDSARLTVWTRLSGRWITVRHAGEGWGHSLVRLGRFVMAITLMTTSAGCALHSGDAVVARRVPVVSNAVGNWAGWQWGQYGIPAEPVVGDIQFGYGVAVGPHGGIYYASYNGRRVTKVGAGGQKETAVSGLTCGPSHVAVNSSGDVFIAEYACGIVAKYTPQGKLDVLASGYGHLSGLAVAANGTVYFTAENGAIYQVVNGTVSPLITGLHTPEGLAVDAQGNLFFGEYGNPNAVNNLPAQEKQFLSGKLMELTTSGTVKTLASGLWRVRDIALAPDGSVYFVEESNYNDQGNSGTLGRFVPGVGTQVLLYDLDYPEGIAVTPSGEVYFTAERGHLYDAGTILFRYNPGSSAATHALNRVDNVGHSVVIIAAGQVANSKLYAGKIEYRALLGGSATPTYVVLPVTLVNWAADFQQHLPMPGSWWPLPKVNVTLGSANVGAYVYLVRSHIGRRWPTTIVGGKEVMASGFSEAPMALIVAYELPVGSGSVNVQVSFPAKT